jgi:hypothetical protein
MLKINYEFLINLKEIKLISVRHISTFQIRLTVNQLSNDKKVILFYYKRNIFQQLHI